jgi:hypothetical protein
MNLVERIESFAVLGEVLRKALNGGPGNYSLQINDLIENQQTLNPWFTPGNTRMALNAIADELTEENLLTWSRAYPEIDENRFPFKAGVIMAGNIPLAGFHDFLSVLITGNNLIAKTSSKDSELIVKISDILCSVNPGFSDKIEFTDGILSNFEVVIATGSNNSSRYFEYYFGRYPNIIRKNRNSISIIDGNETEEELEALGTDIFSYFGLGCRNVSKIYVPRGYDLSAMISGWNAFNGIISHLKYANNHDFNKAVFIVNKEKFLDTGYLLLKEEKALSSPVSVLHYEYYYDSLTTINQQTELLKDKIQCIVGRGNVPFGKSQSPHLWDYADGIDTVEFLLKKKMAGIL